MRNRKAAGDAADKPKVQQSFCHHKFANTTPDTNCITETIKLNCLQGPNYAETCTIPGSFFQMDTVIELSDIDNLVIVD